MSLPSGWQAFKADDGEEYYFNVRGPGEGGGELQNGGKGPGEDVFHES